MSEEEALNIARKYFLYNEVKECLEEGLTPEEALMEWDLY